MAGTFDANYIRIGLNISYFRKLKGLTQMELAERAGISRTFLSNIEAPKVVAPVSLETLFKICEVLDIEPKALFEFR